MARPRSSLLQVVRIKKKGSEDEHESEKKLLHPEPPQTLGDWGRSGARRAPTDERVSQGVALSRCRILHHRGKRKKSGGGIYGARDQRPASKPREGGKENGLFNKSSWALSFFSGKARKKGARYQK